MSFLTGKTKTVEQIPSDVTGLRKGIIDQLGKGGLEEALTGLGPGGDITPFMQLFQRQLAPVLAQAKESAGTLTGSGLGTSIGSAAGRSTSDFLLNLLNQRANRFSQLLSGFGLTGVGPPQIYREPGLLDYATGGAAAAAPFFAGRTSGGGGPASYSGNPFNPFGTTGYQGFMGALPPPSSTSTTPFYGMGGRP